MNHESKHILEPTTSEPGTWELEKAAPRSEDSVPRRAEEILYLLERRYGVPSRVTRQNPMDELVSCILSQHTSDINSGRAFGRLKQRYPTWEAVAAASVKELADVIRCGGLADSKAPRIQSVLREIRAEYGKYSLECLDTMSDREARKYLLSLHGVGPKTAAIVLCFALDRPVMPVDTHIFRVAWRLGLIERRIGEAKAHDALQAQVAPDLVFRFHVGLITHGRVVCKALRPQCGECMLTNRCAYFQANSADLLKKVLEDEKASLPENEESTK